MMKEENLIIIGGSPRSGTSLVQKILDLNSNIYGGPEFDYLIEILALYKRMVEGLLTGRQSDYYNINELNESFRLLISSFFKRKRIKEKVSFISEKTPNNALIFNDLFKILPSAKYIFVVRNPKAIINSMKEVYDRSKTSGGHTKVGISLMQDLILINKYFHSTKTFIQKNEDKLYIVSYEKLVNQPKEEISKLCKFINVDFEEQMLNTEIENDSSKLIKKHTTLASAFYTKEMFDKPIDKKSLNKWNNNLSRNEKIFIDDYFINKKYSFLKEYVHSKNKKSIAYYLFILKQLGLKGALKKLANGNYKYS